MPGTTDPPPLTLGERLRQRRWQELRLLQQDVARAASLSPGQLSEIERGHVGTTEPVLRRLAAALGLDPADLIAQAEGEGRLWHRRTGRGQPDAPIPPQPLTPDPARPSRRPVPPKHWVTVAEAAQIIGCLPGSVYAFIHRRRLAPARRTRVGGRGKRRWLISTTALAAFQVSPYVGMRSPQGHQDPPEGYLSVDAYATATGLTKPTLYRRLAAGKVESIKVNGRRWVRIPD